MINKYVVSRDDSVYEAWPDVVLTKTGKLICVFSECAAHTDRTDQRIAICESYDRGRTWTDKKYITPKMPKDDFYNCPRISEIEGKLVIICDRVHGWETDGSAEQHIWVSEDDGQSWSEPYSLPFCGIVPDKVRKLKCGRLLVSAHYENKETGKLEQYLWYSDDKGKTWSRRITVGADKRYNLCEACIYECEDGTLVAYMRENSHTGHDGLKAISYDSGETWSEVYNTSFPGACHRPTVGKLMDGRLFMTFRSFNGFGLHNCNTFMALFEEDTVTKTNRNEQTSRLIPLDYDRNSIADCGYTGWVQFDDGEIYVVNYIKDDCDKAQIRGYSFYPNDIVI